MTKLALEQVSVEDLKAALAKKEKSERAEQTRKQKAYEKRRDGNIEALMDEGRELSLALQRFKAKVHATMDIQAKDLMEYGKIRTDSKGGFTVTHSDCKTRIKRRRDTDPSWDERAEKAVELIKAFLFDTVKKADAKVFQLLIGFLERNMAGDLEYSSVMQLLASEKLYDDSRWVEGLNLIRQSYNLSFKAFGYEFQTRTKDGKWNRINLNFASI